MTLAELIKEYRKEHGLSMREFGRNCGFSNSYISTLESGVNPNTGKILKPTLETYKKIATAMGITIDSLFSVLQDGSLSTLPLQQNTNPRQITDEELRYALFKGYEVTDTQYEELLRFRDFILFRDNSLN